MTNLNSKRISDDNNGKQKIRGKRIFVCVLEFSLFNENETETRDENQS